MGGFDDVAAPAKTPPMTSGERPVAPTGVGWSDTTVDDGEDELVGQTLSNTYVIERVLAEGGMGRVYLARHTRIRRKRLAVKVLHPEFLRKPEVLQRFQREVEAAAAIVSPHVVAVYDVDETPDGRPFLVAELLDGVELGDLLDREGKLTIPSAVRIVRQICEAMKVAHAQGVIHRDMKPENVFLTGRSDLPHAKVLDFGISRLDDGEGTLTQAGTVMGTPAYMPPEQARGEAVDERADVYAVGAVLYRAITGKVPFEREDPMATMAAIFTEEPPSPRLLEPAVDAHLETIIQRAMAKRPEDRFASMAELQAALAPFDDAAEAVQDTPPVAEGASGARAQLVMVLGAAGLLGFAGLATTGADMTRVALDRPPSAGELAVVLACLLGAGATPVVLLVRHLRDAVWDNTARVLNVVEAVRRPLLTAAALYGAGWALLGMLIALGVDDPGAGWSAIVFVLAGAGAGLQHLARRPGVPLGSPVLGMSLATAGLIVALVAGASLGGDGSPALETGSLRGEVTADEGSRASDDALEEAGDDVEALEALAEAHPKDPRVLERLFFAHAEELTGLAEAMEVGAHLAELDESALKDDEAMAVVRKATGRKDAREDALDLLAEHLGSEGIDILYELARGDGSASAGAADRLADPEVRARGTPALRIAYDMREAEGCSDKAALLDRATEHGDERTAAQLRPLTVGSKRGCGLLRLSACPARCAGEAKRMRKAVRAIEARER